MRKLSRVGHRTFSIMIIGEWHVIKSFSCMIAGIILCIRSACERQRYYVMSSLNGWAHAQNDPCDWMGSLLQYLDQIAYRGRDKMVDVLQKTFLNGFSWMKMVEFRLKIPLKFVHKSPVDNNPALVQIMAWCWTGDKSLSQPVVSLFIDAYMQHAASMS